MVDHNAMPKVMGLGPIDDLAQRPALGVAWCIADEASHVVARSRGGVARKGQGHHERSVLDFALRVHVGDVAHEEVRSANLEDEPFLDQPPKVRATTDQSL